MAARDGTHDPLTGRLAAAEPESLATLASPVYHGRSRIFNVFGLRIVTGTGKDTYTFIGALGLILLPAAVFFALVAPHLWRAGLAAPVVLFGYFVVQTIVELVRCSVMDPGIIPRDLDLSPPLMQIESANPVEETYRGAHSHFQNTSGEGENLPTAYPFVASDGPRVTTMAMFRDVVLPNNQTARRKWCETCRTYRPLRTSHCSVCDNCIDAHDHHCPWTGTCVGRRNYRHFFLFVMGCALLSIWAFCLSIVQLTHGTAEFNGDFVRAIAVYPASIVLVVYTLFMGLSLNGLFWMHVSQIWNGFTTHESVGWLSARGGRLPF